MCLIAHVSSGKSLSREIFDNAGRVNPDGIGVMSIKGIEKFYGNKQLKRARAYVAGLAAEKIAHAVHWRFATHGTRGLALCHPFKLPRVEAWLMHNGIIGSTANDATDDASDTLLFVNKLIDAPNTHEDLAYWNKVCSDIGRTNKGLVMYPDGHFITLNAEEGVTIDGIWYSNQYSLPLNARTGTSYFLPARMRPNHYYSGNRSHTLYTGESYYDHSGRRVADYSGPFGSMIYWSNQFNSYGYWEMTKFHKVKVIADEDVTPEPVSSQATLPVIYTTPQHDALKCPRCMRYKKNPPMGFLPCWCTDEAIRDYLATHKEAAPSGPTLERNEETKTVTVLEKCEHGADSWENCRECIAELEADGLTKEVQKWLADRNERYARRTPAVTVPIESNVIEFPKKEEAKQ